MKERDYDSTVALMAGHIAAGLISQQLYMRGGYVGERLLVERAVNLARLILAETKRTESAKVQEGGPA